MTKTSSRSRQLDDWTNFAKSDEKSSSFSTFSPSKKSKCPKQSVKRRKCDLSIVSKMWKIAVKNNLSNHFKAMSNFKDKRHANKLEITSVV